MSSTALTIERYAEMRAEMEVGKLRDDVLGYAGIDVETWTAEQRVWLEKMGAELERGRFELTNRYSRAFLERQRALVESKRSLANPTSASAPSSDVSSSPPGGAAGGLSLVHDPSLRAAAVSMLAASPTMPSQVLPNVPAPRDEYVPSPWIVQNTTKSAGASTANFPPPITQPAAQGEAALETTLLPLPGAPNSSALPFRGGDTKLSFSVPQARPPASPTMQSQVLPVQRGTSSASDSRANLSPPMPQAAVTDEAALETTLLPLPSSNSSPLPFRRGDDIKLSFSVPQAHSPGGFQQMKPAPPISVQSMALAYDEGADVAGTLVPGAFNVRPALPFQPGGEHPLEPMAAFPPSSGSYGNIDPDEALAGTTMLAPERVPQRAALPFQGNAIAGVVKRVEADIEDDSDLPTLPPPPMSRASSSARSHSEIAMYAALCAELAASPRDAEAIFAKYGLASAEKRKAFDEAWKDRLRKSPALYAQWQQLYRESLSRSQR